MTRQVTTREVAQDALLRDLSAGFLPSLPYRSPSYFYEIPWAQKTSWPSVLPTALLVQKGKEQRAVLLQGLGSFPVLWSLLYAHRQWCVNRIRKLTPRRRRFSLQEFNLASDLMTLAGHAKLKLDERFSHTQLGFMLNPIEVVPTAVPTDLEEALETHDRLIVIVDDNGELVRTNAMLDNMDEVLQWRYAPPIWSQNVQAKSWHPTMQLLTTLFLMP